MEETTGGRRFQTMGPRLQNRNLKSRFLHHAPTLHHRVHRNVKDYHSSVPEYPLLPQTHFGPVEDFPLFSTEDLDTFFLSLKNIKAPVLDRIPDEALKKSLLLIPDPQLLLRT